MDWINLTCFLFLFIDKNGLSETFFIEIYIDLEMMINKLDQLSLRSYIIENLNIILCIKPNNYPNLE